MKCRRRKSTLWKLTQKEDEFIPADIDIDVYIDCDMDVNSTTGIQNISDLFFTYESEDNIYEDSNNEFSEDIMFP